MIGFLYLSKSILLGNDQQKLQNKIPWKSDIYTIQTKAIIVTLTLPSINFRWPSIRQMFQLDTDKSW